MYSRFRMLNQRLKRRVLAFETIFNEVFGLVRNQRQFSSRRIDFTPRTYFVTPKTETKYEKILDTADFANRETCFFIRLNDGFRKTCSRRPKKNSKTTHYESRVQSNTRADFKLTYKENFLKKVKTGVEPRLILWLESQTFEFACDRPLNVSWRINWKQNIFSRIATL